MKSVISKLAKITGEIKAVSKDGKNSFSNYDYISYEQLNSIVRPLLSLNNIVIAPNITEYQEHYTVNDKNKEVVRSIVKGTIKVVCGDTGEVFEFGMMGADQDTGGKSMSQAVTEFEKRALFKLFKVSSKADVDPDSKTVESSHRKPTANEKAKTDTNTKPKTENPAKAEIERFVKDFTEKKYKRESVEKSVQKTYGCTIDNMTLENVTDARKLMEMEK